ARSALLRSLLADRRTLVVLDDVRDPDQVRPLLPGGPGCFVVVTGRTRLTGLAAVDGARPIRVNPLPPAEARELLARRVGTERIRAEPEAVDAIVDRCAHLPLALSVVAARAAARPDRALAALAAEADGSGGRPETIGGPGSSTSVRAAFSPSYDALDDETARLFRLLGL